MRNSIWTGTLAAIAGAATVAVMAQAPAPQTSASADKRITVTGCLKAAPPDAAADTATGTAGTSGVAGTAGATGTTGAAGAADQKFVLSDATMSPAASPDSSAAAAGATAPPPSTPGEAAASQSAQTYRLVANPASLSPHVGKKLELTGTLVDDAGSAPSATSQGAHATAGPALRVEAGKVLASSCQQ